MVETDAMVFVTMGIMVMAVGVMIGDGSGDTDDFDDDVYVFVHIVCLHGCVVVYQFKYMCGDILDVLILAKKKLNECCISFFGFCSFVCLSLALF